jgi:hypothetical protein
MISVEIYQKRLQDEIAAVQNEINRCNQQIEASNKRLEGLKRALELFDSDQSAVTELLRTSLSAETAAPRTLEPATPTTATKSSASKAHPRVTPNIAKSADLASKPRRRLGAREQKAAHAHLDELRAANNNGKVKRTDLIAAVLQGNSAMTVKEIITALNKEFGWKCKEGNLTGHLYTNPKRFTHTEADRSGKNPVRWSLT